MQWAIKVPVRPQSSQSSMLHRKGNIYVNMKARLSLLGFAASFLISANANAIPNHSLHERGFESGWNPLGNTSTILTSDPIIESWGPLRLDAFGRGQDSDLLHNYWDGQWHDWGSLGGFITTEPTGTTIVSMFLPSVGIVGLTTNGGMVQVGVDKVCTERLLRNNQKR